MTEPIEVLPFARSYWVAPGKLLAGADPGDPDPAVARRNLAGLVQCGVGLVINLRPADELDLTDMPPADYAPLLEEAARARGGSVRCARLPIRDHDLPTEAHMRTILDTIDQANAAGQVVYVHCWAGKGRTGTVVGCWLARHGLAVGVDALWRLNELVGHRATSYGGQPQTGAQRLFVRNWPAGQ